jgi:hypothetical protein
MRLSTRFIVVLLTAIPGIHQTSAQDKPAGKVHGYVFGDYFYKFAGDSTGNGSQYSSLKKDEQAFQFRRLYLYYDHTFSEKFAAQFLLEGNDKVFTDGKHGVFIKTAYVEWKEVIPLASFFIGLIPTPTWSLLPEKVWNYRSIEKTIMDFRGLGSASDIGVQLRGKFDEGGTVSYVAMIANGTGQKPENNKYKKYYVSLSVTPTKETVVEAYGDYEPAANDKNKTTLKGFAAYQSDAFTLGVELFQQIQQKAGVAGADKKLFGLTVFAWAPLPGVSDLNAYARFDLFNPDTKNGLSGFNENFITVGLDYMPIKNVHFMPNIWVNTFSNKASGGTNPDADVVGRITFFYIYK